jgi:defect in organelle trafficking protein DotC
MRRLLSILCLLPMAACASGATVSLSGPGRADVNPGYDVGRIESRRPILPSLKDMENIRASHNNAALSNEDKLRIPAMRDAALAYGAQGGLAVANQQINNQLRQQSSNLTRTYDFNRLLIRKTDGASIMPPIIASTEKGTSELQDAGRTLRVADSFYEIVQSARLVHVAPLWQSYLMHAYAPPKPPEDDEVLPKNAEERALWKKFVDEGYDKGVEQAKRIFTLDMKRLNRDFVGIVTYDRLLEAHQVSPPCFGSQSMGVTGSGEDMRVNDRVYRLTCDSKLNVQRPDDWNASVSNRNAMEAATPPGQRVGGHEDLPSQEGSNVDE